MKANLKAPYKFTEPIDNKPYFFDFVPRIINTQYILKEAGSLQNHPAVDVFLVDRIPDGKALKKMYFKLKVIHALSISKRERIDYSDYKGAQKLGIFFIGLMGRLFSLEKLIRMYDRQQRKYENVKTPCRFTSNFAFGIQGEYRKVTGMVWRVDTDVAQTITLGTTTIRFQDITKIESEEHIFDRTWEDIC